MREKEKSTVIEGIRRFRKHGCFKETAQVMKIAAKGYWELTPHLNAGHYLT